MNARWEKGTLDDMGNRAERIKQVRKRARLSQEKFAEVLGEVEGIRITRGAVGNWELGGGISRANLAAISDKFNVDLNWLERGKGIEPDVVPDAGTTKSIMSGRRQLISPAAEPMHNAQLGAPIAGYTRVPLRGQSMGGKEGALIFVGDDNFGDLDAPPKLHGVPDAYAVYVIGDSMMDRLKHGEVCFVHPYEPYKRGDDVVIQIQAGEGAPVHGWIKRFLSMDDKTLKVQQLHPKKVLTFARKTVLAVHKIVFIGAV
jgi:phage repressor protein C with HTH and peptisase S24 domain